MELMDQLRELGATEVLFPLTISAPTGAGKTYAAFALARQFLDRGQSVVYLTPLRAQAMEVFERHKEEHPELVLVLGGRPLKGPADKPRLIVATYEALFSRFALWRRHLPFIASVGLLVIDEVHLLEAPGRGPVLEQLICWAKRLNPRLVLLAMSGTIGSDRDLCTFLESGLISITSRPVPLAVRVVSYERVRQEETLLELLDDQVATLVFVHSRRKAVALAEHLQTRGIDAAPHHAGLDAAERATVERGLRARRLSVVVATPTLEMGLNLPVSRVICLDLFFYEEGRWRLLNRRSLHQRLGRAGRPGLDETGEGIIMVPRRARMGDLLAEGFEPLRSRLVIHSDFTMFILREVTYGLSTSEVQLQRAADTTLAGAARTLPPLGESLDQLVSSGFLTREEERLIPSPMARLALRRFVDPFFLAKMVPFLVQPLTPFDLLLLISMAPEADARPLWAEELDALNAALEGVTTHLLPASLEPLIAIFGLPKVLAGIKSAVLLDRTPGRPGLLHGGRPVPPGRSLGMTTQRYLGVLTEQALAMDDPVRRLQRRVLLVVTGGACRGLGPETALMTLLPGISATTAKKLAQRGIDSLEALMSTPVETLRTFLPRDRPEKLRRDARTVIEALVPVGPSPGPTLELAPTRNAETLLRLQRALTLAVIPLESERWQVRGAFSTREIEGDTCSCPDAALGHRCKHLLAVDLATGRMTPPGPPGEGPLDLGALWFASGDSGSSGIRT